jgi:hypothetical protein
MPLIMMKDILGFNAHILLEKYILLRCLSIIGDLFKIIYYYPFLFKSV